jgi:CheY-like chemotaxis protein
VLVVEDEPAIHALSKTMLEELGSRSRGRIP